MSDVKGKIHRSHYGQVWDTLGALYRTRASYEDYTINRIYNKIRLPIRLEASIALPIEFKIKWRKE